jgi:hypothetical protein
MISARLARDPGVLLVLRDSAPRRQFLKKGQDEKGMP